MRAIHLIASYEATKAYIDNALAPLVKELRRDKIPGSNATSSNAAANSTASSAGVSYADQLLGWEIFNEPEGNTRQKRLYHNYQ